MAERTLIIIKPDGIQRRLAGEVISRFERKGLKLVAAKLMQISREQAERHYAVHKGKPFFPRTVEYLSSGPVLAMVWEGDGVIAMSREMMGSTFGAQAKPGTIRGDFSSSRQMNLVHASDGPEAAQREIALYFKPAEICEFEPTITPWLRAADEY